jgi:hypothetical protein
MSDIHGLISTAAVYCLFYAWFRISVQQKKEKGREGEKTERDMA